MLAGWVCLSAGIASAQIEQSQSVQDVSGRSMTHGTLTAVTSGGQFASGVSGSADGRFANYSGFLAGVLLRPLLDIDGDGLCDELDDDNDSDRAPDWAELIADTYPTNAASVLAIVDVSQVAGGVRLEWTGGESARQVLMRTDAMDTDTWVALATNLPPTPTVTNFVDQTATVHAAFYKVVADRPGN